MSELVAIYMSIHRNSHKCDKTFVLVVGRGNENVVGFNFETGVICDWGVKAVTSGTVGTLELNQGRKPIALIATILVSTCFQARTGTKDTTTHGWVFTLLT